ncbi:T9SS type A sorting domain-containing protein [Taibaiella soli]|uniref:Secretion system C-terminal sorting domain-containing protein n=1 Tax=Taibaiella soli TaxID=1649169 RepID=A0A2W2ABT6_9BACT|nr:T9SS type A sorting domain-containing protein [Taibaiella soli]PZF72751.1 hypothetical protein DN068_12900 [Taibaiella soli]
MKSLLLMPMLALSLFASTSQTSAQINCVSGATISANSFCIFLTWNGNGPSSFSGVSVVYNGSTYTFVSGAGTSASPASFKSGGGGGSCNSNQTSLTSLAGQSIQFVTGSGSNTCLVAPTPLPITLSSFTASASGSSVQINWTTETEKNVNFFSIQRSTDGTNWKEIGKDKPAAVSSDLTQHYSYTDNASEISGQVYYRLVTVDYSGEMSFSDVRTLKLTAGNATTGTKVYPTVTNGKINISGAATDATILLTDLMGSKVSVVPVSNGSTSQMDIQQLPAGMYILNILSKQGNESFKIVKQ